MESSEIFAQWHSTKVSDAIHPYVEEDLKDSESVSLEKWVEAVLKLPRSRLDQWTSKIGELKWFEDEIIHQCLTDYCKATVESKRYEPFAELANRVIALARGNLPGVRKTKSYPIDDIHIVNNADRSIEKIPEHGVLGAARRLDILVTHGAASRRLAETGKIQWADILHWYELKYVRDLTPVLDAERSSRGIGPVRRTGRKAKTSTTTKLSKPRLSRRKPPDVTAHVAVAAGTKRLPEDNLLTGLNLGSSNKRRERDDPNYGLYLGKDAAVKSGSYALELLSCTYGTRVHCHGSVLKDDKLFLWYYDASGMVYTVQYLSLIQDFEKVAAIIVGLACCKPEQFGALPVSIFKMPTPYPRSFPPPNLNNNVLQVHHPVDNKRFRITLKRPLYSQYVLKGRRTFAYTTKTFPCLSKTGVVVKFAYQVSTRQAEHDLVTIAREAGVKNLPTVHMWSDLWQLSEGTRRMFFEKDQAQYEDRTLRMIVYSRYASIKPLFTKRCKLIPVMVEQMIDCLHDLRYKASMLHRDISVDNIMYEMRGDKFHFILIDFDMAVVVQDTDSPYIPSSKHRTGTLPFMAYELVQDAWRSSRDPDWKPIRHLLRHDYESLFWIALWCVITLLAHTMKPENAKLLVEEVAAWEKGNLSAISSAKQSISNNDFEYNYIELPAAAKRLEAWFDGWEILFSRAHAATKAHRKEVSGFRKKTRAQPEPFDDETAGGILSKDAIKNILIPLMPFRQTDIEDDDPEAEDIGRDVAEDEAPKASRQTGVKASSADVAAIRARVLSRLRPRKKAT